VWSRRPVQRVRSGGDEQHVDLWSRQEGDQRPGAALGGDRQHPGDELGMLGVAQCSEREQRVDGGQPRVPGGHADAADFFQVGQEPADRRRVEVLEVQRRRALAAVLGQVAQQQPEGVAVGGDGVWADLALSDQPVGEERLEGRGEGAHGNRPMAASRRWLARSNSSGQPDRYQ